MSIRFNVGCCCNGCIWFLTDVTGSMGGTITTLKPGFKGLVDEFVDEEFAVASYRDDIFTPLVYTECSSDQEDVKQLLDNYTVGGGGDTDEDAFTGLKKLAQQHKPTVIIWTGDAKSHTTPYSQAEVIEALTNAGTKVLALNTGGSGAGIDGSNQASDIVAACGGQLFNSILSVPFNDVRDALEALLA